MGKDGSASFFTTRLDDLVAWGQKNSLWPLPFGTSCCGIEMMATLASDYDMARFGAEAIRFSPRQADMLIVAGIINLKMAPVLKTVYDQMKSWPDESIYEGNRLALPDEVVNFQRGDGMEKAITLVNIAKARHLSVSWAQHAEMISIKLEQARFDFTTTKSIRLPQD